jgi:GntR family transcriptional regulator
MIFRIDPRSGVPLYLQLIEQLRHAIEIGALRTGDQLPGMRKLAEELVMNPNTVAKAYREMEHAGLIELRHGAGAFVAGGQADSLPGIQKGRAIARRAVTALRGLGLDAGAIRRLESELAESDKEKYVATTDSGTFGETGAIPAAIDVQHRPSWARRSHVHGAAARSAVSDPTAPADHHDADLDGLALAERQAPCSACLPVHVEISGASSARDHDLYPRAVEAMIHDARLLPALKPRAGTSPLERFDLPPRQRCNKLSKGVQQAAPVLRPADDATARARRAHRRPRPARYRRYLRCPLRQAGEHGTTIFFLVSPAQRRRTDRRSHRDHPAGQWSTALSTTCGSDGDASRHGAADAARRPSPPAGAGGRVLTGFRHDATELGARLAELHWS